jgi:integrase
VLLLHDIIPVGKFFRAGNGEAMRRRFQAGEIFRRGKRREVWVGRYWEPALKFGRLAKVRRSIILGACSEMTRSRAKKALTEKLRPINEGLHTPGSCMTFGELWGKWKEEMLPNYRESTRGFYQATMTRWILGYFEGWPLEDITPLAVQQFVNKFGGYSKSVLRHVRATLSRVLASAVDWQFIPHNPALSLRLPAGRPAKRAPVLSPEDLGRVTAALEEPYRSMVVIETRTGMRESELLALKWEDFDPLRRVATVRRSVYRGKVNEVKTPQSYREIPYGETVSDALRRLEMALGRRGEYLFIAAKGGFFAPQRVTRMVFKPLASRLGLAAFSWRSFRRSAATAMHMSGVPLKVQQQILGHSNSDMSLLYTDPDLEAKREAMSRLDSLMDPKRTQVVGQRVM